MWKNEILPPWQEPFICKECEAGYVKSDNLKQNLLFAGSKGQDFFWGWPEDTMQTNNGEKPFDCKEWEARISGKNQL